MVDIEAIGRNRVYAVTSQYADALKTIADHIEKAVEIVLEDEHGFLNEDNSNFEFLVGAEMETIVRAVLWRGSLGHG